MTILHKLIWIVNVIATPVAFVITVLYWVLLFDGGNDYWNVYVHGLNSVAVVLDLGIGAKPWRLHHCYPAFIYGLGYILFSLFYYLGGGEDEYGNPYIYDVLDWRNPGKTIGVVFGAILGFFLVYLLVYGLYRLRIFIYQECACGSKNASATDTELFFVNSDQEKTSRYGSTKKSEQVYTITE